MKVGKQSLSFLFLVGVLPLFSVYTPAYADLVDAEQAEAKARSSFIEKFITFLQDKNVMGRVVLPNGEKGPAGPAKSRFDQDDGVSYKSDLTYHDFAFNRDDEQFSKSQEQANKNGGNNNKGPNSRTLFAHISAHGGIAEGGGSSQLERTVYQLHDKFSKEDADPNKQKQQDEQKGVKFKSVFKVETKEVFKQEDKNAGGGAAANDPNKKNQEPDKVERFTLREEAQKAVDQVGVESAKTIEKASRDQGFEDDEKTLSNSSLLYEAAGRATESWWNATLANLGQRNANRAIRDQRPTLSEEAPTCEAWVKQREKELQQIKDPKAREEEVARLKQTQEKCQQVTKMNYTTVNPKFEKTEDGKGEKLETGDLEKEDPLSRDLRNQLEVLGSAGKDVTKLKANWKYESEEDKQEIAVGVDEETGESKFEKMSVREQMESYNSQLDEAKQGFKEVKERFPTLEVDENELEQYKIQPETRSAMEINRSTETMRQDLGADPNAPQDSVAQTYDELVQKNQGQ